MSKRKPHPLPRKPEFAMTGLAVGAGVGLVVGLVIEIVRRRSMIVMQAGGIAGITVGALAESVRFWWRKHRQRKLRKETEPPVTIRR